MISTPAIAATLPPKIRKDIGIQALSKSMPIACIARENRTSRKFVYEQKAIAAQALDESFVGDKSEVTPKMILLANSLKANESLTIRELEAIFRRG